MSEGRVVKVTNGGKSTVGTVASIYETTRFVGVGLPNEPVWFIKIRVRLSEKDEVLGVSERYVSNYYAKGEWEYLD